MLKNIANNLDCLELKNFRLINKCTNAVASSMMLAKDLPVVKLKYNAQLKKFVSSRHQHVDDLVKVIKESMI